MNETLAPRLREIVHQSVATLGEVIRHEVGQTGFERVEKLRVRMTEVRGLDSDASHEILRAELKKLRKLSPKARIEIAQAFTLMLELMNACENAYRSHEIRKRVTVPIDDRPDAVIYVLTAHPTEARAPVNIWIFHEILKQLTAVLDRPQVAFTPLEEKKLRHSLELAWHASIVRQRKPRVIDEAEHIYSTLLRDETLRTLLKAGQELAPIYLRSWVGGDKDGHPGVDEKVFLASVGLSRKKILDFCHRRLHEVQLALESFDDVSLLTELADFSKSLRQLRAVAPGDAKKITRVKQNLASLEDTYVEHVGILHPSLGELKALFHVFPGLVVPLEFRESSDILMGSPTGRGLAIDRMLKALGKISRGGDPRWYVRGFIISMASRLEHLQTAAGLVQKALGNLSLPIIPLFEEAPALANSPEVIKALLQDKQLSRALKKQWGNRLEVMLGYSDSSKESGVLKSRLQIAETMHALDHLCHRNKILPIFFQGSGGSTDRGGGSIVEQTAWWSSSALRTYKVTIQGEMVERSLANPDITRGQIERIVQSAGQWKKASHRHLKNEPVLDAFATKVSDHYEATVQSPKFLQLIEHATPYPFLNLLKIGSRPTKRTAKISVKGLRAIPWILCWTQTRVLFPTWWGVGLAWEKTSKTDQQSLVRSAKNHPLFASYVRALGYTLAKVELPVWRLYIDESALSSAEKTEMWNEFSSEFQRAMKFVRQALQTRELIAWRPWLQESIILRSPMIHPLNLLQIIAMQERDASLLRVTVTGISSGMMTTG